MNEDWKELKNYPNFFHSPDNKQFFRKRHLALKEGGDKFMIWQDLYIDVIEVEGGDMVVLPPLIKEPVPVSSLFVAKPRAPKAEIVKAPKDKKLGLTPEEEEEREKNKPPRRKRRTPAEMAEARRLEAEAQEARALAIEAEAQPIAPEPEPLVTMAELDRLEKEMKAAQKDLDRALTGKRIADRKSRQQTKGLSNVCDHSQNFQSFKRSLHSDSCGRANRTPLWPVRL